MRNSHIVACSALFSITAFHVDIAAAQTSSGMMQADQQHEVLEVTVVTAQRRVEDPQKAAVAVTAVTPQQLVSEAVIDPEGLSRVVPSLQVTQAAGPYPLFYLRGVGNMNGNALSDSAVAFNVDGVFIGRPSSTGGFFYDLERVEVLKGPQGTLYGRNATGGAVNVITKGPEFDEFSASLNGEFGNYGEANLNGAVNVPIAQDTAMRFAGQYVRHDAYLSDGTSDEDSYALRASFRTAPIDSFAVRVTADYYKQQGTGDGSTLVGAFATTSSTIDLVTHQPDAEAVRPSGLRRDSGIQGPVAGALISQQFAFLAGRTMAPLPNDSFQNNRFYGVSSIIEWTTDLGTLTIVPGWRQAELDYRNTVPAFLINQRERDEQHSVELRFASPDKGRLQWLVGGYYLNENIHVPLASYNQQVSATYQSYKTGLETEAAFGRATFSITDALRATGGVRYTNEDKELNGTLYGATILCSGTALAAAPPFSFCFGGPLLPNTAAPPPQLVLPDGSAIPFQFYGAGAPLPGGPPTTPVFLGGSQISITRSASFHNASWRAGLEWDVGPQSLLYATFETGYKSGGFFFTHDDPVYKPETVNAWSLGSKNRFLDGTLQLNLEAFNYSYKNQQISHVSVDTFGVPIFKTENVGAATIRGVELESELLVLENTNLSADVQYLDARYDGFVYTVPAFGPPIASCPAAGVATPGGSLWSLDCSGKRPPNAPQWTFAFNAQHTIPLGAWKFVVNGHTAFQSTTLTSLEFQAVEYQKSFWRTDLSVTLWSPDSRYYVTGFVNNIEGIRQMSLATPHPFVPLVSSTVSPPRLFGARIGATF